MTTKDQAIAPTKELLALGAFLAAMYDNKLDGAEMRKAMLETLGFNSKPPAPDWLLSTTQDLARNLARRCFPDVPQFEVLDDLAGVISQIDNMTCGMERKTAPDCRTCSNLFDRNSKKNRYGCNSLTDCTNGDQYQPAPKLVLWRTE